MPLKTPCVSEGSVDLTLAGCGSFEKGFQLRYCPPQFTVDSKSYRIVACLVTSSIPVPLKTRRVDQRCTLNLSRAETSTRWSGVVVGEGGASSGVVYVTSPWFKITWSVAKSPRVAERCGINIQSIEFSR
ncbi:uncharacterized protein TNCV_2472891 [Trichonephila clavipes]|nr:uncharacterized protein TNCV_2472891 [Trichonephila clavipes]